MNDKYAHLIYEPVNRGKSNYKQYIRAEIVITEKRNCKFTSSEVNRLKYQLRKAIPLSKYGTFYTINDV